MKNTKRFLSLVLALSMLLALNMTAFAANDTGFTDVAPDADYSQAVAWCYEEGLMQGVSSTSFAPDATLTRAMVATVLYRAAGEPAVSGTMAFTDTQPGQWYSDAVIWATAKGIVQGYGNGLFGTNDPVTLEQLDVMIRRYNGENPAWIGDPSLNIAATRSQAATSFYNNLRTEASGKVLVAYFSASGNTENVAKVIADTLGADLFEMVPETPYTSDDLNWTDPGSRVNAEHNDPARQEIKLTKTAVDSWADYDTVFIGYPLWWRAAAWPVNEFVKNNDFTGKTVIPFCTSTSDGLGQSGELLAEMAGGGDWQEGRRFSERAAQSDIAAWVKGLDLPKADTQPAQNQESKVLVAYFSMPETTNPNNMTAEEDNSVVVINGEVLGNTQYMAQVIQRTTNADIYRIEPKNPYPTDHTTLVAQAREEQDQDTRPAIKDSISNFDSYDTVFIGYPIWWSDLPQILYTFFDAYDFSGKTVIPFSTHGGSSFAGTPATIQRLEPGAKMLDGLTISRNNIQDAEQEIISWVNGLDY